jgi:hypothetical protein
MHVINGIPLGSPLLLPVGTVNCAQTLKSINASFETTSLTEKFHVASDTVGYCIVPKLLTLPGGEAKIYADFTLTLRDAEEKSSPSVEFTYGAPFFDRHLHSRMPLVSTPLLRLKRCRAWDQRHSSRASTFLTSSHCKFHPHTEGATPRLGSGSRTIANHELCHTLLNELKVLQA